MMGGKNAMFAIIVAGHGEFPAGLINATEMILGEQEDLISVPLLPADTPETYYNKLKDSINSYDEFVILTDLKGGTPNNVASMVISQNNGKCISGTNLPLLLEMVCSRLNDSKMEVAVAEVLDICAGSIVEISKF